MEDFISFGPVPSRRLGRSLGVNNIPAKICSYGCVYCQIGKTLKMDVERRHFYDPVLIYDAVKRKINYVENRKEKLDYITFVPDGEPTLDQNLGKEISMLKELGYRVAVITNSSLIWREDVRNDLYNSDLVSLKVDTVNVAHWKKINRPHRSLDLERILSGIMEFSKNYKGKMITETMVIGNFDYDFDDIGKFLANLKNLEYAYISVPTRPTAEEWVKKPDENVINSVYNIFSRYLGEEKVQYLIGYEGEDFSISQDPIKNLLSITSVHPMREDAVSKFLEKSGLDQIVIDELVKKGELKETYFYGKKFYVRKIL